MVNTGDRHRPAVGAVSPSVSARLPHDDNSHSPRRRHSLFPLPSRLRLGPFARCIDSMLEMRPSPWQRVEPPMVGAWLEPHRGRSLGSSGSEGGEKQLAGPRVMNIDTRGVAFIKYCMFAILCSIFDTRGTPCWSGMHYGCVCWFQEVTRKR